MKTHIARNGLFLKLPIPYGMKSLESDIRLGRSVLDRALLDSLDDETIIEWFDAEDEDFCTICYIANLDPEIVVKRFESVFERLKEKNE